LIDAVVLAGTGKSIPLTEEEGVDNKAFIDIKGSSCCPIPWKRCVVWSLLAV
jgi:hypothetical protein